MTGSTNTGDYAPLNISPKPVQSTDARSDQDKTAFFKSRDEFFKEQLIRAQEIAVLRDKLGWCYKREGVNHYESCRELAVQYMKVLQEMKEGTFTPYK